MIVVSGDTSGFITPCGCASNQSGGLPRRAELVRRIQVDNEVVVVDVGGAPSGTSPYDRLKFEAILRGELAMGLAAHNIGRAEALLGSAELRRLEEQLGVPWLSANVCDPAGKPLAEPLRIVTKNGLRVALVGVLDPEFATDVVSVSPVVPSILNALDSVKGQYDVAIVLAYLEEETLRETAATMPEVDAVIGGPTGQPIPPVQVGPTLLTSATNQGKFMVKLDVPGDAGPWQAEIVELNEQFADDAQQLDNVQQFYDELAERSFSAVQTSFVTSGTLVGAGGQVAGTERCQSCHETDHEIWADSGHAHAWQSLLKKKAHVDPDCQRCHTTGYGLPNGFDGLKTKEPRFNVGCESCHGPSLKHAEEPELPTGRVGRAADSCLACHDRENSPKFCYEVYWPQIAHGDDSAEEPREN